MKGLKPLLALFFTAFLVGCGGDPAFVYLAAPQSITPYKQEELRSAVVSLAHKYNLSAIQLASTEDPTVIGFIGNPCVECSAVSDAEGRYRLSFAYVPRRNAIVIQLLYGPDESESSKSFRISVEAMLTRLLGANGFTVEKESGVRSIAS